MLLITVTHLLCLIFSLTVILSNNQITFSAHITASVLPYLISIPVSSLEPPVFTYEHVTKETWTLGES